MLVDEIILQNEIKTSWTEVKRALFSELCLEDVVEVRAFGSCVKPLKKETIKGKKVDNFFSFLSYTESDKEINIYPKDIDILVIVKTKPNKSNLELPLMANYPGYEDAGFGYGFTYEAKGYRKGLLHITVVSKNHWNKALKSKDHDTVEINNNSVKL